MYVRCVAEIYVRFVPNKEQVWTLLAPSRFSYYSNSIQNCRAFIQDTKGSRVILLMGPARGNLCADLRIVRLLTLTSNSLIHSFCSLSVHNKSKKIGQGFFTTFLAAQVTKCLNLSPPKKLSNSFCT